MFIYRTTYIRCQMISPLTSFLVIHLQVHYEALHSIFVTLRKIFVDLSREVSHFWTIIQKLAVVVE